MPFPFSSVCDLLSKLERIQLRNPPVLPKDLKEKSQQEVQKWFRRNRLAIDAHTTDQVALLSTLFPERRTDRKFELREARLCKVLGRCLLLNKEKKDVLDKWRTPGNGDLGICAEKAQREFDVEMKPGISITVEEVDQALELLASRSQFSGPNFRSFSTPPSTPPEILEPVFRKMTSHELKWAVRLILKDFSPVILDERLVLTEFHFLLPGLLKFQDSFAAAVPQLRGVLSKYHAKPDYRTQHLWRKEADKLLAPQVGMKVGRPPFLKARSIQSAVQLAGTQKWTLERKYDGEYCEIHVDLSKSPCTQIFSKSGKDSTDDRRRVHAAIRQGLKIGQPDCLFTEKCIVVGELVVWNNRNKTIAGFEKIRKHVTRSGRYIGTEEDSQPHPWENLMIVYFDVLLIDNEITMRKPQFERRDRLNKLIQKKEGIAITADWNAIDFSHQKEAPEKLCTQLAAALASRFEGLVLKPAELPYFTFGEDHGQYGSFIKLKKDYLPELGGERDVADFAIVGASYDPKQAHKSGLGIIPYTTFHIGCIREEDTVRFGRKPVFEIVGTITQEKAIPKPILQALNDYGRFQSQPFERTGNALKDSELLEFDLILDHNESSKMAVIFTQPGVVEILGSSYEQVQNKNYFMLRHPRISKIHLDRDWKEATTMDQLKQMAEEARTAPTEGQSQE
ncbi:DNA ligase/mRNA capping enzyme, partial [Tothia fuscella]